MSKKIVVLTGSPREKGNSSRMAQAFADAARKKGHQVTLFDTAKLNIGGCRACDTCYSTGKACSFDDGFNTIAPAVEEADAVVFAAPTYWYTFPAQIKAAMDKMYAFMVGKRKIGGKQSALIACCEEDDAAVMDGLRMPYERSIALLGWTSVGEVLLPGVRNVGDVEKTDGLARAAALAEKM